MTRQGSNGAFGLWAADSEGDDLWLDAFVTDFLTRARERNFAVPQIGFDNALDHLRNSALNASDPGDGAAARLCALRARPQRPAGDRRSALSRRHQARRVQDADGARASRRGAGDAWRPRPRGPRVRRGAVGAGDRGGEHAVAPRLRIEAARRRGAAGAARRSQPRRRGAAGCARSAPASCSTPPARRPSMSRRRRTTGWRSPPKRSPSDSRRTR